MYWPAPFLSDGPLWRGHRQWCASCFALLQWFQRPRIVVAAHVGRYRPFGMMLSKVLMGTRRTAVIGATWVLTFGMACASTTAGRKVSNGLTPRDTRIVHEECPVDESGVLAEDVNGDGRPDRRTVSEEGRVVCRALDFNFDGVVDAWVYFDSAGKVRRRESDYDRDGRVDEVAIYKDGMLVERDRATTLSGKLDTWQHYQNGKVAGAERDSNGDEYVDQWWEYPDQRSADCPLIHSDVNGDGRPDPGATVDVCKDQYVPGGRDGEKASGDAEGRPSVSDVPTEVDPSATSATPDSADAPAEEASGSGAGSSGADSARPSPVAPKAGGKK